MGKLIFREVELDSRDGFDEFIHKLVLVQVILKESIKHKFGWPVKTTNPLMPAHSRNSLEIPLGDGVSAWAVIVCGKDGPIRLELGAEVEVKHAQDS